MVRLTERQIELLKTLPVTRAVYGDEAYEYETQLVKCGLAFNEGDNGAEGFYFSITPAGRAAIGGEK